MNLFKKRYQAIIKVFLTVLGIIFLILGLNQLVFFLDFDYLKDWDNGNIKK